MLAAMWAALGGGNTEPALEVRRAGSLFASPLAVEALVVGAAGCALLAAAELAEVRSGRRPEVALDAERLAVAAASERHVRLDGAPPGDAFAPLSAFLPAADGWVRLHANYAWHADALRRALGDDVPAAVAGRRALEVEDAVVAAGGCAAAVRAEQVWQASPPGAAVPPLVRRAPGPAARSGRRPPGRGLPAAGLRVLDLTRVIAGPVGTRMLAALGADVVRLRAPHLPELPLLALDGGIGKRWWTVDLRAEDGRAALEAELARTDVVVCGHRPGALDAFGLAADALAERHPHVVHVALSAWGDGGPWGARRGFDSLVQAATGIAVACGDGDGRPGALPVQALDHATGYLVAAAALRALAERERTGTAPRAALALAATAAALLRAPRLPAGPAREVDPGAHLTVLGGRLRVALPPGELDGRALSWPALSPAGAARS